LSRKTKILVFRPGKAPYNVVERTIGEGVILENALDILIEEIYPDVIKEAGINPYGPGALKNMPSLDPPTFEFVIPLDAEVQLGDYRQIRLPYELKVISDKDVEGVLNDLLNRQAVLEPSDQPAKEGDQVYIRIEGKKLDVEEGQNDELIKERPMPIIIELADKDTNSEWPFPGFSRELLGHNTGANFEITHTFSDESEFESLRGTRAKFIIKVEDIKSRIIPELDDSLHNPSVIMKSDH
jgi:trigger factor